MKQNQLFKFGLLTILSFGFMYPAKTCTNFLITKGASKDGSTMISYAADSHTLFGELYHWPAKDYPEGTMLKVYEWDTGKYLGKIKQARKTYNVVGNMNEYQVAIGETTFGGRDTLATQPGAIMDYGSLMYIALQRSKTAREAIKIMTDLVAEYGYYSSGESFSVSDPNEVWIFEMIGKGGTVKITKSTIKALEKEQMFKEIIAKLGVLIGKEFKSTIEFEKAVADAIGNTQAMHFGDLIMKHAEKSQKGAVWVAMMIPDGYVSSHANHARIETFPFQKENNWNNPLQVVYHSSDVASFARQIGLFKGDDADFNFSETYAPVDFGGARFCELRVWSFFNKITKGMEKYWDYSIGKIQHASTLANGKENVNKYATNRMPLWVKPIEKISVHDVMNFMRDHLEGTELDMSKDIGAGPWAVPYRWRPMTWKVDGVSYCNERVTATQQTGFSFVSQSRSFLPDEIGGIIWFGVDDAASSVYFPMYSSSTSSPEYFSAGFGDMMEYKKLSAFWVFNEISNLAYTRYSLIHPEIHNYQQELEKKYIAYTTAIDAAAMLLYKSDKALAVQFLTEYSVNTGNDLVLKWRKFYEHLFTKFMDGNVKEKVEVPAGYKYIPAKVTQPGYNDEWKRKVIENTGNKLKVGG